MLKPQLRIRFCTQFDPFLPVTSLVLIQNGMLFQVMLLSLNAGLAFEVTVLTAEPFRFVRVRNLFGFNFNPHAGALHQAGVQVKHERGF